MGRKAIDKARTVNPGKQRQMAEKLLPLIEGRKLEGLTMDDLAEMLGRSKATIYKYFRSREELFDLALTLKLERIQDFLPLLQNADLPYLDRYFQALELLSRHLSTISNDFLADLQRLFPRLWEKIEMLQALAGRILHGYYQEGVERGILEPIHPAVLVLSDRFLFQALSDPQFLADHQLTIQEAFAAYFKMKFFGIVRREGDNG
ncbi:MAG: TetR/AcrR family transcriptional regulator [Bacteroidota bacterium]